MTAKKKFYLVCETNIGPRSHGDLTPDNEPDDGRMIIQTEPGRKNTSHEVCCDGELGTTNDIQAIAYGQFNSLEQAVTRAHELGYIETDYGNDTDFWLSGRLATGEETIIDVLLTSDDAAKINQY